MDNLKLYFEIASHVAALLGIPVAIFAYVQEKRKERREREYGTYNALDDKYIEFLKLCLDNKDLDVYNVERKAANDYTPEQKYRETIIFEILISILERAFLMYRDQSSKVKKEQWEGWNGYMEDWLKRENFQKAWEKLGYQWEDNFEKHMNKLYQKVKAAPSDKLNDIAS